MAEENLHHKLLFLVGSRNEVKSSDAAKVLGLDEKSLLDIAGILGEHKILDLVYTLSGDIVLKPGVEFKRSVDELSECITENLGFGSAKSEAKSGESNACVDDFLSSVRKSIAIKKSKGQSP